MDLLVTYDVDTTTKSGQRRLRHVAEICERFGVRVQLSVFECRLEPRAFESLKIELSDVIDRELDTIDIYRFDRPIAEIRTSLGRSHETRPGGAWVF